jgi:hypothetical protein
MAKLGKLPKPGGIKKSTGTTPIKPKKFGGMKKLKGL